MRLFVLYDEGCPMCTRFRDWLAAQAMLVQLDLVPAGSPQARSWFPDLDHERTLTEITVVADDGRVWTHEHAWVMCLWATAAHRPLGVRLSGPAGLPLARAAATAAAGLRGLTRTGTTRQQDGGDPRDYREGCVGTCGPLPQG